MSLPNLDMSYDALGNITSKSEGSTTTNYNYNTAQAGCSYYTHAQPHALRKFGAAVYCYDQNGNMISRDSSAISWYSYNLPNRIDKGNNYSQFFYGASRDRYKQIAYTAPGGSLPSGTETTIYVGGLYEKVIKPSGVVEHKHYIMAGKEAIAIRTLRSNSVDDTRYLHKDHLGSVDTITNESGSVVQRLSYDAFGKRRSAATWAGVLSPGDWTSIAAITHRAFTFHEQLDNVDLVHMNGRVYDPNIGRFISADPFIQAPLMSQSLNRYSYVMNNPLSLIDPSGFSWLSKAWKSIKRWAKSTWDTMRTSFNYIAAAALFVVGTVMNIYAPGSGAALYAWAAALVASPVQVGYGRDGPWIGVGIGFNGVGVPLAKISMGGGGAAPPMTAPAGAVSFGSPATTTWGNSIITFDPAVSSMQIFMNRIDPQLQKLISALAVKIEVVPGNVRPGAAANTDYDPEAGVYRITLSSDLQSPSTNPSRANYQASQLAHELYHVWQYEATKYSVRRSEMASRDQATMQNMFEYYAYKRQVRTADFYGIGPRDVSFFRDEGQWRLWKYNQCMSGMECSY